MIRSILNFSLSLIFALALPASAEVKRVPKADIVSFTAFDSMSADGLCQAAQDCLYNYCMSGSFSSTNVGQAYSCLVDAAQDHDACLSCAQGLTPPGHGCHPDMNHVGPGSFLDGGSANSCWSIEDMLDQEGVPWDTAQYFDGQVHRERSTNYPLDDDMRTWNHVDQRDDGGLPTCPLTFDADPARIRVYPSFDPAKSPLSGHEWRGSGPGGIQHNPWGGSVALRFDSPVEAVKLDLVPHKLHPSDQEGASNPPSNFEYAQARRTGRHFNIDAYSCAGVPAGNEATLLFRDTYSWTLATPLGTEYATELDHEWPVPFAADLVEVVLADHLGSAKIDGILVHTTDGQGVGVRGFHSGEYTGSNFAEPGEWQNNPLWDEASDATDCDYVAPGGCIDTAHFDPDGDGAHNGDGLGAHPADGEEVSALYCGLDRNTNCGCDTDGDGDPNYCDGDYNNDGVVDSTDYVSFFFPDFTAGFELSGKGTDHNCDGVVDSSDLVGGGGPGKFLGFNDTFALGANPANCDSRPDGRPADHNYPTEVLP